MKLNAGHLDLSATDLATFSACRHATALDLSLLRGEREKPHHFSPVADALRERGLEHEQRYVADLRDRQRLRVLDLRDHRGPAGFTATLAAMREGVDVIVQATLIHESWNGIADVLLRKPIPSTLGDYCYWPIDTKLATETRAGAIVQLSLYAALLEAIQGTRPEKLCVVVPAPPPKFFDPQWEPTSDFDAYFRWLRSRMTSALSESGATAEPSSTLASTAYPEPVEHCDVCRWWQVCDKRRRDDDHLSLVAGATRLQRRELEERGVTKLAVLAEMPIPLGWKPERGSAASIERVREQARIQLEGRTSGKPEHELLLPVEPKQGLALLPEPSPTDVFLDLEGDAFAPNGGREYLFGLVYRDAQGHVAYDKYWATTRAEEREAFETVVAFFERRRAKDPGFHVYHYAAYEPVALKRLMGRYGSCEDEVDQLLREERFVDLYRVVRQSLRASVERYSIKDLEVFYDFERKMDLRLASQARRAIEKAIESGNWPAVSAEERDAVELYNREDCVSALELRDWLEKLRRDLEAMGTTVPRFEREALEAPAVRADLADLRTLSRRLTLGISDDPEARMEDQKARWLLAQLLEFHHREWKAEAWEFFRLRDLSVEDLLDERAGLVGLRRVERVHQPRDKRSVPIDRYVIPQQDWEIERKADVLLPLTGEKVGSIADFDRKAATVDIKLTKKTADRVLDTVLVRKPPPKTAELTASLVRIAEQVLARGLDIDGPYGTAMQLLLRTPPRLREGSLQPGSGEEPEAHACRVALALGGTVLPIQGPPGTGKTHTAARMICALVRDGKKIGVLANSHKVIQNLLLAVEEAGSETGTAVRCLQKVREPDPEAKLREVTDNAVALGELTSGSANVLGSTTWLWANPDAEDMLDVLFIDEAGQMSLANTLAAAPAAKNLVLVGDPQQLEQPIKGSHPDGVEVSPLDHLFGEHEVIPEGAGLFLPVTRRLAPAICTFTSDAFYAGELDPHPDTEQQRLVGTDAFDGAGLWYVPVEHTGNQSSSMEEVDAVERLVDRLLVDGSTWINMKGEQAPLTAKDVLVIAPYNAQVGRLTERLGSRGIAVGTVDKFQGKEAPIVIYSMTTSTPEDAPRGMGFLYSRNRLNVATSRARCACILVGSPRLFEPECRSVEHVRLANAFCRYRELARVVAT